MAADEGHEAADAAVESFLRDARQTYREAQDDAGRTLRSFLAGFEAEDAERRADVAAGRLAEDEYREWRRGRMLTGRRYRATLDQVAWCYTHANEVAMAALSGRLPEVFAENYNYGTYQVEAAALVDTTFALQDASTAQTLLADRDAYLPKLKVDEGRDRAWNRRLVSSQLAQGVALGEGIPDIAARVARVTGSNVAAATRAARTSVTAAECAGRVESYRRAQGMGVRLGQEWLATLDERTRSSHRQLDGERVEVGGKFSNGCRYPGDPAAPYSETCNCRCTLVAAVDGVDQSGARRWSRLPEGMTYEQWKTTKPAVSGPVPANRTISEFMDMPGTRRKLDAAGVSATEARKLLTARLREYGIPSGSFRRMSAGDQQSVFDGALWSVYEGAAGKGNSQIRHSKEYAVDMGKIAGKDYRAKVAGVVGKDEADGVLASIRRILAHRGGTNGEDLYAIDLATSKTITSCVSSTIGSAVEPPAKFGKKVEAAIAEGRRVALLHNHPASGIPSAADLLSVSNKGCELGIIAAHDGSIYTFRKVGEPAAIYNLTQGWVDYIANSYGDDEARMFRAFREKLGFEIEHLA